MEAVLARARESSKSSATAGKVLSVSVAGRQFESKGGHVVGSALTNYYRSEAFMQKYESLNYTNPIEVVLMEDSPQALYCHLLCGLLQASQVWCFESGFAFNMDAAFTLLRQSWKSLCNDIRDGTLCEEIKDENVRKAVLQLVRPNPDLADLVERECSKPSWEGIVRSLWPNALYIQCRAAGTLMKPYVSRINDYSANLPIYGLSYGASEGGHLAICTEPTNAESLFTFMPTSAFFELIPLNKVPLQEEEEEGSNSFVCTDDKLKTVEFEGLQLGHYYQPVVTTFQGLYRYRLGDVVRVVGFNKASPVVEYVCRNNVLLSVNTDKTDEGELYKVVEKASLFLKAKAGVEVFEYSSCVDHSSSPGHYVLFMELDIDGDGIGEEVGVAVQECCCLVDTWFNHVYKKGRKAGRIGALEVRIVKRGTFEKILQKRLERGASMSQYKPPRCIVSAALHDILKSGVVGSYRSRVTSFVNVYGDVV